MVDADKMLPDRFTTILVTSSGSATPDFSSVRSSGLRALIPSPIISLSKVLITKTTLISIVIIKVDNAYLVDFSQMSRRSHFREIV